MSPSDNATSDEDLTRLASAGDTRALTVLLRRHERWIFNLALHMLQTRADAEDATQEILLKITTGLGSFRGDAAFSTWARSITVRHLLDRRRSRAEAAVHDFACYERYLEAAQDQDLPANWAPQERELLVVEAQRACTLGMLLCLDRAQRMAFVLGEILELSDSAAAEIAGISRDNLRQRLARARRDLTAFLRGQCGLVDANNPCRCARKTQAFVRDGIVDPARLQFVQDHVERAESSAPRRLQVVRELRQLYPLFPSPELVERLANVLTPACADAEEAS
jgi:RNA polymerase sigma factor (sigma-70 family)